MNAVQVDGVDTNFVRGFVGQVADAWASRDPDGIAALCTDDVVWEIPGVPEVLHGREAGRQWLAGFFAAVPDVTFEFPLGEPYVALAGAGIAGRWRWRGTMLGPLDPPGFAPTHGPVQHEGIDLYELRDGRIARYTMIFDQLSFGQQIGAAPPSGSPAERVGLLMQRLSARRERRRHARRAA